METSFNSRVCASFGESARQGGLWLLRLLVVAGSFFADASACSCLPERSVEEEFQEVDLVFLGTVLELTRGSEATVPQVAVRFEVIRGFKGVRESRLTVVTPRDEAACGFPFREGKTYLVYAHRRETGPPTTTLCSRTRPLSRAREDLQILRGVRD